VLQGLILLKLKLPFEFFIDPSSTLIKYYGKGTEFIVLIIVLDKKLQIIMDVLIKC